LLAASIFLAQNFTEDSFYVVNITRTERDFEKNI